MYLEQLERGSVPSPLNLLPDNIRTQVPRQLFVEPGRVVTVALIIDWKGRVPLVSSTAAKKERERIYAEMPDIAPRTTHWNLPQETMENSDDGWYVNAIRRCFEEEFESDISEAELRTARVVGKFWSALPPERLGNGRRRKYYAFIHIKVDSFSPRKLVVGEENCDCCVATSFEEFYRAMAYLLMYRPWKADAIIRNIAMACRNRVLPWSIPETFKGKQN